ncbi:MAG: sporulation protein, partial [Oscillospiraceae bacterium]|nr:sporulation protein [Oscillospiraceae bacterium]
CNNSGPAFIFGVVGAGVFASGRVGLLLYLAHTLASVLVGVLFRFYKRSPRDERRGAYRAAPPSVPFTRAFANSVRSAAVSTVNICGFVIFFTIFIKILFKSGAIPSIANLLGATLKPFGMTDTWAERLLTGFIELSSGVWTLKNAEGTLTASVAMAAFMLGWAGISVHTQVLSFVGESGLSVRTYIVGKALQGVLSAGIIFLLGRLIPFSVPASAIMADQVQRFAQMSFGRALLVSGIGAAGLFVVLLGTVWVVARRDMRRNGIV